ncbi:MAG: DUF885 domain-containing protein [Planctomycetes bacterium]|nr:DUF885 domain-containing protein [Planctomycetota bacterium]
MRRLVLAPCALLLLALWHTQPNAAAPHVSDFAPLEEEYFRLGWNRDAHARLDELADRRRFRDRLEACKDGDLTPAEALDRNLLAWRLDSAEASAKAYDALHTDPWIYLPREESLKRILEPGAAGTPAPAAPRRAKAAAEALEELALQFERGTSALTSVNGDEVAELVKACEKCARELEPPAPQGDPAAARGAETLRAGRERALSALRRLEARVREGLPRCGRRPNGVSAREDAAYRLRWDYGVEATPEELLDQGYKLYDETQRELARLAETIAPGRTWRALIDTMKEEHPAPEDLLAAADREMHRALAFVRERDLVSVPDYALNISTRWGDPKSDTPFGHYQPPDAADPRLQGSYVVIPLGSHLAAEERAQWLRGNNIYWIRVVSLHEAIPGHHLQFAIALHNGSRVQKLFYNTSFVEGWGLYCEEMMFRNGYNADAKTRLSQLKMRLWRAARVVIDVGSQLGLLSKEEALGLLANGVGIEPALSRYEVGRYLGNPLYYSGYVVGEREIERLRRAWMGRPGPAGSEKEFHDRLLRCGPVPFATIRRDLAR